MCLYGTGVFTVLSLGISVAKGCQLTESLGRITDHRCVDVSSGCYVDKDVN